MSGQYHTNKHLAGIDFSRLSAEQRVALFNNLLERKIYGIAFSPYMDGQGPGTEISEAQILERLNIIKPYVQWVRTFSCTEGHQAIPRIAHENGLKTMVGVGLSDNR